MNHLWSGLVLLAQQGTTTQPSTGTPASSAPAETSMSLWNYIQHGGFLGYVLIGLSVAAFAMIIHNLLTIRYDRLVPTDALSRLEQLLGSGSFGEAEMFCKNPEHASFVTRVVGSALTRCNRSPLGMMEFRSALEEAAQAEADEVHRTNDGIGIVAAVGPMLGLLGTVIGMIGAFASIGKLEGAARSNELAVFMSMALVNTAQGLAVAIPCTIAFSLFRRRIDRLMQRVGVVLERIAADVSGRAAPAARPSPRASISPIAPVPAPSNSPLPLVQPRGVAQ